MSDEDYRNGKKAMAAVVMRAGSVPGATLEDVLATVAAIYGDGPDTNVSKLADDELAAVSVKMLDARSVWITGTQLEAKNG